MPRIIVRDDDLEYASAYKARRERQCKCSCKRAWRSKVLLTLVRTPLESHLCHIGILRRPLDGITASCPGYPGENEVGGSEYSRW